MPFWSRSSKSGVVRRTGGTEPRNFGADCLPRPSEIEIAIDMARVMKMPAPRAAANKIRRRELALDGGEGVGPTKVRVAVL